MICRICGKEMQKAFNYQILGKYKVDYFKCGVCGFLCTEKPFWLDEAYQNPITCSDTGLLERNIALSRKVAVLIYKLFDPNGRYLDYAGGYGVFSRLMRDSGFEFYHVDPFTQNIFARDIEWEGQMSMDGITCFECFEHLVNPMEDIERMIGISSNIVFSTVLIPESVPPKSWDYYGFEHGQHIAFYSHETLFFIARKFGVFVFSVGNLHLFTSKPMKQKYIEHLIRNANRPPHPFTSKTNFTMVVRKMRK